ANSLTAAEINSIELRAQLQSAQAALATPVTIAAFVEAQQFKGKDLGDREYDDLRAQLAQHTLALATSSTVQGAGNPRVIMLQSVIDSLKDRLHQKERSVAEAQVALIAAQLSAAETKERQIRSALQV